MKLPILLFTIFLCLRWFSANAQTAADLQLGQRVFKSSKPQKTYDFARHNHENEYVYLLAEAFLFYKKNISSQDLNACNFHPSCSEYAMISVKEMGVIKGIMNGFDRLTRCHPGAQHYYAPDSEHYKLSDPLILLK